MWMCVCVFVCSAIGFTFIIRTRESFIKLLLLRYIHIHNVGDDGDVGECR